MFDEKSEQSNIIPSIFDNSFDEFPLGDVNIFHLFDEKTSPSLERENIFSCKKIFKIEHLEENISENYDYPDFLKKKRSNHKKKRYTYKDNILQKIKRNFFNIYLINYLNEILKKEGYDLSFQKFPQYFTNNTKKEDNIKILNMTLGQIFMNQELYKQFDKNYFHNMNMAQILKEKNNSELYNLLNRKTIHELYEDYLNSQKFKDKIDEIKQEYKGDSDYVKKYISYSKNFLKCF